MSVYQTALDKKTMFDLEELRMESGGRPWKERVQEVLSDKGVNDLTEEEKLILVSEGKVYDLGLVHYLGPDAEDMVIQGYVSNESPLKILRMLKDRFPDSAEHLKVVHIEDYVKKNQKMKNLVAVSNKEIAVRSAALVMHHEELLMEAVNEAKELLRLTKMQKDYATANRVLNTIINAAVAHAKITGKMGVDGSTQVNVQINQVVESVMKDGNTYLDRLKQRRLLSKNNLNVSSSKIPLEDLSAKE